MEQFYTVAAGKTILFSGHTGESDCPDDESKQVYILNNFDKITYQIRDKMLEERYQYSREPDIQLLDYYVTAYSQPWIFYCTGNGGEEVFPYPGYQEETIGLAAVSSLRLGASLIEK